MTKRLDKSLKKFSKKKEERLVTISGELGLPLGGQKLVEVPNRKGFVYVRLKNNTSEVIQAYNSEVSTIYGLAVLVARQNNIYKVIGRDLDRYRDWSDIPYLPKHGGQHSFNQALGMGADITWIYSQQLMPLLGYPSGSNGSNGIIVAPHLIRDLSGNWKYVGNTGTPDISMYRPSIATGAVMVLVYIDTVSGNPYLLVGSGTTFHAGITGTSDLAKYIPQVTNPNWMPNTAVRLTSGTTQITWTNLYDARPFLQVIPTGTSGGSSGGGGIGFVAWDEGVFLGTGTVLNFVGDNVDASISGSVVRVFVTGSGGGGINTGTLDARYLKLDASNDPVTGLLTIIPSAIDTPGLEIETMGDASSFQVTQRATGTSSVLSPVFSLVREPSGNSVASFSDPIFLATQSRGTSGTATGPLLSYLSEATERVNINPNAQGTGTLAFIDGDFTLSPDGLLLLLKNHGTSRFYVNASGTAYSNGVPLVKEAPADGNVYARRNAGWERLATFSAYNSSSDNNVTGDNTAYTIIFDTEISDPGSNYDASNGKFTAPITGMYLFTANALFRGVSSVNHTELDLNIVVVGTSGATYTYGITDINAGFSDFVLNNTAHVYMTAGDTAEVQAVAFGNSKVVDIFGTSTPFTRFGGSFQG